MVRPRKTERVLKWFGTALCVLIVVAFLYSTRRFACWDSPSLRYEFGLMLGSAVVGWRPDDWSPDQDRYPARPGWSVASYGGEWKLRWWIVRGANRSWEFIDIPLWMPLLLFAIPTGILWYRDRRSIPAATNRWLARLRPRRRQRLTLWLAAAFAVIHLVVVIAADITFATLYDFFFPRRFGETRLVATVAEGALPALVWGTPLFGTLWAWLFVRLRNRLLTLRPSHYCVECGYDLTGNVSGRCPECGHEIRAAIEP